MATQNDSPQATPPAKSTPNLPQKQVPVTHYGVKPDDLPYINVVEAALVRKPKPGPIMLATVLSLFLLSMLVWAYYAGIDEVTRAEGQVIPSQSTQIIQNLEGGILGAMLVKEGQIVEADAPLAQLDNKLAESQLRDVSNRIQENELAIIRLEAELVEGLEPLFSQELEETALEEVADQRALYAARTAQARSELSVLEAQYEQRRRETEELESRKALAEENLRISREQRNIARPLMERKIYSRVDFLGLEKAVVALEGELASLESLIPKAQAATREAEERIYSRQAEMEATINAEISKRRTELTSLKETLAAGGDKVTRTELRAPVRGTVNQIYITTVGGVIKPGEPIMEIVPLDDSLLVEARIRPADVAFLHPGQEAMVKVTAYDFSIYGGLEAHLEQISPDTIEGKEGEFFYLAKLRTQKNAIEHNNEFLPIIPGMIVSVDILTGRKTILSYLLKPILKAKQEALRER